MVHERRARQIYPDGRFLGHDEEGCTCDCYRHETFLVEGVNYDIFIPWCVTLRTPAIIRHATAEVEKIAHRLFVTEDQARYLINKRTREPSGRFLGGMPVAHETRQFRRVRRYTLRDLARAMRGTARPRCFSCGQFVDLTIRARDSYLMEIDDADPLRCGFTATMTCGVECEEALRRHNDKVCLVRAGRLKKKSLMRKELKACRNQLRAIRKYLRTGDPEVLLSHRAESRHLRTSPT